MVREHVAGFIIGATRIRENNTLQTNLKHTCVTNQTIDKYPTNFFDKENCFLASKAIVFNEMFGNNITRDTIYHTNQVQNNVIIIV